MLVKIEKLKKLTILFVDDEESIISVISDTLEKLDINFYVSYTAEEALEVLKIKKIDLLVIDINLSTMNGLDLLRILRSENNNIDSVIMSAYTEDKYKQESMELGVKKYITKPFDFLEFLNVVDRL